MLSNSKTVCMKAQYSLADQYKSAYKLYDDKVSTSSPTRELIISDTQCVYEEAHSKHCKTMSGSVKKPLCVFNYGDRKVKADVVECTGMNDE